MKLKIALAAILLLGLCLRGAEAWDGRPPVYDAQGYAAIAADLERGEGFTLGPAATQPASNYSPGLPLLVAGIYELSGGVHERTARLVLAAIGTLAVLFSFLIGRRLAGPGAGLFAAAVVAIYPALLEYQGMLMGEPVAATLLSGAVLAVLWAAGTGGRRPRVLTRQRRVLAVGDDRTPPSTAPPAGGWLVPGLLLGALALVRPEYLAIALLVSVVVFARLGRDEWRPGMAQALVLLVGVVVVVAPWTVRNAVALDRFVPVSTGGGQVLFAGSYMPSGGDPERVGEELLERHPGLQRQLPPGPRLEQILAALAEQRYPELETDAALARIGRERLWRDVSEEPVDYVGFLAAKVWRVWASGPRRVMEEPGWRAFHLALVALALAGLVLLAHRRRWEALLLGVVLLAATATGALLVASPRRVLVTIPLLAALAGVAATALADSLSRRWRS